MLITLQGNVGTGINTPILNSFDDVIFCNIGGKSTMSLNYKNIPPMEHNDIPTEILIKDRATSVDYTKVVSYDKLCWLSPTCHDEYPPFRFQIIYDGYDFLYYPEFKLYERPYLLMDFDLNIGNSFLTFIKNSVNDNKNLTYLSTGQNILFKDYNTEYRIINITDMTDRYLVYLDRDIDEAYFKNDIIVFKDLKYELQSTSNLLNDSTTDTLSPFKFKFIDTFDNKNYVFVNTLGQPSNYTLTNDVFNQVVDLLGDDKIASISKNVDIVDSTSIALNISLNETDTILEITSAPQIPLDVHSYVTIKSTEGLEIVKLTEKISPVKFTITRGAMDTIPVNHPSGEAVLFFPKFVYFIMLPVNKELSKRYVVYRNIDFVLTLV